MIVDLKAQLKVLSSRFDELTGGCISILTDAARCFGRVHAAEAAASVAFYALFSLFPFLLALIAAGSFVLESKRVRQWVLEQVTSFFPVAQQLIEKNISGVLELRGTVGIIALLGLTWSATSVLTILARNINRAWIDAPSRSFLRSRLLALGMVGGLVVLVTVSSILDTVLGVLARFSVPLGGGISVDETPLWTLFLSAVPRLIVFFALVGLYRWVPNTKVRWIEAFWGALAATPAGEIATYGFAWYLSSGLVHYELIYGSLGTVVALMLWIYIGILIILFGAHLSAAVARHAQRRRDVGALCRDEGVIQ